MALGSNLLLQANIVELNDSIQDMVGMTLFDSEIDEVIFRTNEFLTTGADTGGPFWYIGQMCMCLAAVFAVIMAGGMAYKMMVKGEPFDPLKVFRVFAVACVLQLWWVPGGVLDCLAFIPNAIGSWTHDMYMLEASQVQETYNGMKTDLLTARKKKKEIMATYATADDVTSNPESKAQAADGASPEEEKKAAEKVKMLNFGSIEAGIIMALDQFCMWFSLVIFRIGWWGTMYCQQILLGMLTIFGPIQWAFSLLPKWEGAWAKWITRYLTVHFYGAMLYFVGFYVLLLFDIVFNIQAEMLHNIVGNSDADFEEYMQNAILTAGYLVTASAVAMKCLNLVPDLAAWIIPEGDTAFSTRSFGEGVAGTVKQTATSAISKIF